MLNLFIFWAVQASVMFKCIAHYIHVFFHQMASVSFSGTRLVNLCIPLCVKESLPFMWISAVFVLPQVNQIPNFMCN